MRVCIFCGASPQVPDHFLRFARKTGLLLASSVEQVIFGGGAHGMMGAVADGVAEGGGNITGVLPNFLFEREPPHPKVNDIRVVDNMHERKALMYELSDAFMVLPGGFGTMDETMEVVTWRQLSLHEKPVVFVGDKGFWRGLQVTFDTMHQHGFLSERDRGLVAFFDDPEKAMEQLELYTAKTIEVDLRMHSKNL